MRATTTSLKVRPESGPRYKRLGDLLKLALLLSGDRDGRSLPEIQTELGISRRTAERMLAVLREAFPQMDHRPGEGRTLRWYLPQGTLRRILLVNAEELAQLEYSARRWHLEGEAARAEALEGLGSKLRLIIDEKALLRIDPDLTALMEAEGIVRRPGPRTLLPEGLLGTLRTAILACKEIEFDYVAQGVKDAKRRGVRPLGILQGGRPYLVGSVVNTPGDPTLFRLDRMSDLRLCDKGFERPPNFDLEAFAERSFGVFQEEPIKVCLRFNRDTAEDAEKFSFHPTQTLERTHTGQLLVCFEAGGRREILNHLVTWGESVQIVRPAALRREMVDWLSSLTRHYSRRPSLPRLKHS